MIGCASLNQHVSKNNILKSNISSTKKSDEKSKNANKITLDFILERLANAKTKDEKLNAITLTNENTNLFEFVFLNSSSKPKPTIAKKEFEEPFSAILATSNSLVFENTNIIVEYPVKKMNGIHMIYEKMKIEDDGHVSFKAPKGDASIDGKLTMYIDLFKSENMEEDVFLLNNYLDKELLKKISVSFEYRIATANKRVSCSIAILDYDQNQKPILKENITANKLFVKLMSNRFSRTGLAPFEELVKLDDLKIIENARRLFNGVVDIYVYGRTYIKDLKKNEDGTWSCSVISTIYIWDLKQNKKILEVPLSAKAEGKNQWEAMLKARKLLAEENMFQVILYNL